MVTISTIEGMYAMPVSDADSSQEVWTLLGDDDDRDWEFGDEEGISTTIKWDQNEDSNENSFYDEDIDDELKSYLKLTKERSEPLEDYYDNDEYSDDWPGDIESMSPLKQEVWDNIHTRGTLKNAMNAWKDRIQKQLDEAYRWKYSFDYSTDVRLTAELMQSKHNTLTIPVKRGKF